VPKKNLPRLLRAYAQYRERARSPWALVMCGGGPQESALRELEHELGLDGVIWPGFIQVEQLPTYYGLASGFVMPSIVEQWGLVANEAMASGLPVLVSRTAGCRYDLIVEGETGYLMDPSDTDQMAECMVRLSRLTESERAEMGRASCQAVAEWGPERFARGLWNAVQVARPLVSERSRWRSLLLPLLTHPRLCT
jgi:glycosyltransferase involved in cell wall biosynthesis